MTQLSPQRLIQQAEAALELGRYAHAERLARDALRVAPQNYLAYAFLGRAILAQSTKRAAEALDAYMQARLIVPDDEWLHRLCSTAYYALGRHKDALQAADEAIRLAPELGHGHFLRSKALLELKRHQEAEKAAEIAVKLNPEHPYMRRWLADILLEKSPKRAEQMYREVLALQPSDALALNNLGVALERQRRTREAATAYKAALLADPSLKEAKENIHASVKRLTKLAPLSFVAVLVVVLSRIGRAVLKPQSVWPIATILLITMSSFFGLRYFLQRRRQQRLRLSDPQLMNIYQQLDDDLKQGKLHPVEGNKAGRGNTTVLVTAVIIIFLVIGVLIARQWYA